LQPILTTTGNQSENSEVIIKFYTRNLEDQTEPFFAFVKECLGNVKQIVQDTFDNPTEVQKKITEKQIKAPISATPSNEGESIQFPPISLPTSEIPPDMQSRSRFSFKVLGECPVMLVLLFQMYKKTYAAHVQDIVPLFMDVRIPYLP
jgi:transformation/transcription domain-associated protein